MLDKLFAFFTNKNCFWGHDWEVIESKLGDTVAIDHGLPCDFCAGYLHKQVCMRCGESEDQISDYIKEYRKRLERKRMRHEKALSLWCAKSESQESIWQ